MTDTSKTSTTPMIRVEYEGLIADVPVSAVDEVMPTLKQRGPKFVRRERSLAMERLAEARKRIDANEMTPQEMADTASDIGLWFACDVYLGEKEALGKWQATQ